MKKRVNRIVAFLIILLGVMVFSYPYIATSVNDIFANKEISEYKKEVNSLKEAELERLMDLALAYNQSLPHDYPADPFSGINISDFENTEFKNFSMVKQGTMIGYLEVPSIDIYLPVYYGTSEKVLEKDLGLIENTSLPVGGSGTHAVISGHTGMASRKLFSDLNQMKEDDIFFIHVLNRHFAYKVDNIVTVLPDETDELLINKNKDYVSLLTCTPFGINDHRLIVRGERIPYDFSPDADNDHIQVVKESVFNYRNGILLASGMFILVTVIKMRRDNKKDRMNEKKTGGVNENKK